MKNIVHLEAKTEQIIDDIKDTLYATSINLKATISEVDSLPTPQFKQELIYLHSLFDNINAYISQRQQIFMDFLITRQIQQQEESVRRQRLEDYEGKIYDQRRIIADKQSSFQSLLKPKWKRDPTQTVQEFQEKRIRDRQSEESTKAELLSKELISLQKLKELLEIEEQNGVIKNRKSEMESMKGCSVSTVNCTGLSVGEGDFEVEKTIPLQEKSSDKYSLGHRRTASLQHAIVHEHSYPRVADEPKKQEVIDLKVLLNDISSLKKQNCELSKIYEQQSLCLKFKKGQVRKTIDQYNIANKKVQQVRERCKDVRKNNDWQHYRCFGPEITSRKASSLQKNHEVES